MTYSLALCACLAALAIGIDAAPAEHAKKAAKEAKEKKPSQSHRIAREKMFALSRLKAASVVMLGDSLTEAAPWAEITGCYYLVNRGISGDDSAGVLRRLDEVTKLKPAAVFLMVGVNDINSDVATQTIVDNVRRTINRLTKSGAQVYLSPVLPVAQIFPRKLNPKIEELNTAYKALAQNGKFTLVDFRADMRGDDGYLREELTGDGLHLKVEGYRIWRDAIAPLVMKHCPATEPPAQPASAASSAPTPAPPPTPAAPPAPR